MEYGTVDKADLLHATYVLPEHEGQFWVPQSNREIDKPKAAGQVRKTLPLEMPKWFLWVSQSLALRRGILFVLCYLEDRSKTGVWELQRPHVFLPTATFFLSLSAVCG